MLQYYHRYLQPMIAIGAQLKHDHDIAKSYVWFDCL